MSKKSNGSSFSFKKMFILNPKKKNLMNTLIKNFMKTKFYKVEKQKKRFLKIIIC